MEPFSSQTILRTGPRKSASVYMIVTYDSDVDWDDYIDHIRSLIDKQNAKAMKASIGTVWYVLNSSLIQ